MTNAEKLRQTLDWYQLRLRVIWLNLSDWVLGRPVTGEHPVAVSVTTHGTRLARVHTCIQSIVAGKVRPRRLILWLNGHPDGTVLSAPLRRLQHRGLEIRYVPNYGPHTKYFPYVEQFSGDQLPLVTADDDGIYAKHWLQGLLHAHQSAPEHIHCYWARRLVIEKGQIKPYLTWQTVATCEPSHQNFALGVSGVIYPPKFLMALHHAGEGFKDTCPKADDIWLHAMAVRAGYKVRQVGHQHAYPQQIPFTQDIALFQTNFLANGNDAQINATYSRADIAAMGT